MGKWINFIEQPAKGTTKIFKVIAKEGEIDLGTIKWFSKWRCYSFYPEPGTVFEKDCLSDITNFVKDLMENRKKIKESDTMKHLKTWTQLNESDETTQVEFYFNEVNKDLFAFFPNEKNSDGYACYSHNGQHSTCSIQYVNSSRPATEEERDPLIKELEDLGYKLNILN